MPRSWPLRVPFVPAAILAFATLAPAPLFAQVFVNEILPNPTGTDTGTERVEIYNAGPGSVDMTGWAIDDAVTIGAVGVRARIPEDLDPACSTSAVIGPGEFRLVMMTGGTAVLNNTGDDVYLVSDRLLAATVVHSVTYPATVGEGQVWSSIPNGSANYAWRSPTLCASNGGPAGDVTAPGTVTDLEANPGDYPGEIRLTWTAPGDDGATGTASSYTIKVSHDPITALNFDAAADLDRWITEPLPSAGGTPETLLVFGLDPDSTRHFARRIERRLVAAAWRRAPVGRPWLHAVLREPALAFELLGRPGHAGGRLCLRASRRADPAGLPRRHRPQPLRRRHAARELRPRAGRGSRRQR
jgi:hypothetical protein